MFIRNTAILGASLLGYAALVEPSYLRKTKKVIYISNLPDAFDGFKIAHLTDFHYSPLFDRPLIDKVVQETNQWQPDLIAMTGDFVEHSVGALKPLLRLLAPLQAPYGIFSVLGNHDHHGLSRAKLKEAFSDRNMQLLVNQVASYPVNGDFIQIVGLDSVCASNQHYNLHASRDEKQFRLVLAHEPDVFPEVVEAYAPHLQLSGHTHGGQCRIPFVRNPLIAPEYGKLYSKGLYKQGKHSLFVSSGIGTTGLRIRFACPPEIALLTLKKSPVT